MTEHEAVVARVDGDFLLLETTAMHACGSCGGKSACGTAASRPRRYAVRNTIGAQQGDRVLVSVPDGTILRTVALTYLMPLVFVIAGAAAGTAWGGEGLPAVAGAALGLGSSLAALRTVAFVRRSREPLLTLRFKGRVNFIDKET